MKRSYDDAPFSLASMVAHGPLMAPIGLALSAASTVVGFLGAQQQADAAEADAEFRAKQLEQRSNEERASGQRQMLQERRKKEMALSTLQSRAAGSGAGASDDTVLNLAGGIEREGEYQALTEFYRGENQARGSSDAAGAARATGAATAAGMRLKGFGSLLEGGASFADKYGKSYGKSYG